MTIVKGNYGWEKKEEPKSMINKKTFNQAKAIKNKAQLNKEWLKKNAPGGNIVEKGNPFVERNKYKLRYGSIKK